MESLNQNAFGSRHGRIVQQRIGNSFFRGFQCAVFATVGPATSSRDMLARLAEAGVAVFRLNFSHGTHEEQLAKIHMIKKVREELDLPIAIMLDTKGPEYRTGTFKNGKVHINDGDLFTFTTRDVRVIVYDGKMHPVDSNELSFMLAARRAFSDALSIS